MKIQVTRFFFFWYTHFITRILKIKQNKNSKWIEKKIYSIFRTANNVCGPQFIILLFYIDFSQKYLHGLKIKLQYREGQFRFWPM